MESLTTGQKDIDYEIFNQLTDQDILHLCLVNKKMSHLCQDKEFWERRKRKRYPQYKETKEEYKTIRTEKAHIYTLSKTLDEIPIKKLAVDDDEMGYPETFDIPLSLVSLPQMDRTVKVGDFIISKGREDEGEMYYYVKKVNKNSITLHEIYIVTHMYNNKKGERVSDSYITIPKLLLKNKDLSYYSDFFIHLLNYFHLPYLEIYIGHYGEVEERDKYITKDGIHFQKM